MGDNSHPNPSSSRLGLKATVGEIVEVQGGHIVRSIGRKDRHSKVCTAKGPRDRRVRLAAYTAIQFYDVQDRLGYDRPSKAVDWLIKNAKAAIDELAELPPWHPTASSAPNKYFNSGNPKKKLEEDTQNEEQADLVISNVSNGFADNSNPENSSYLPPSMDSDAISDSMKSFFPTGGSDGASSSAMQQFQSFPTQDLRLSLQSFQDPSLLHQNPSQANSQTLQGQVLLSATPLGFDGWRENNHHHHQAPELSRFQRFTPWNSTGETTAGNGGGATSAGYLFNPPPAPQPLLQQLLGHNQFIQQRGPLQSSNSSSIRACMDPSTPDHSQHYHQIYSSSVSGIGFTPEFGGFSGFRIPTRIQGEEEEHDGFSDKPSSVSSDSRH